MHLHELPVLPEDIWLQIFQKLSIERRWSLASNKHITSVPDPLSPPNATSCEMSICQSVTNSSSKLLSRRFAGWQWILIGGPSWCAPALRAMNTVISYWHCNTLLSRLFNIVPHKMSHNQIWHDDCQGLDQSPLHKLKSLCKSRVVHSPVSSKKTMIVFRGVIAVSPRLHPAECACYLMLVHGRFWRSCRRFGTGLAETTSVDKQSYFSLSSNDSYTTHSARGRHQVTLELFVLKCKLYDVRTEARKTLY